MPPGASPRQTLASRAVLRVDGSAAENPPDRSQGCEHGALHDRRRPGQRRARIAQAPKGHSDLQETWDSLAVSFSIARQPEEALEERLGVERRSKLNAH